VRLFQYERPSSIDDLLRQKAQWGGRASVLAGGQSLLNMMKLRLAAPEILIDAGRLTELRDISVTHDTIRIGAMATYAEVEAAVALYLPILADAIPLIADRQVRNCGTVGGSCCLADPFTDMPNVVTALDATFITSGSGASPRCSAAEFFRGPYEANLAEHQVLLAITLPRGAPRTGSAYEKFAWRRGDYAIASAAVSVQLASSGAVEKATIVLGSLGTGPFRASAAEARLLGAGADDRLVDEVAGIAASECAPMAHPIFGAVDYKRALVATTVRKSLARAIARAGQQEKGEGR
jgi:carbon-monoxide dehydrogenase medium subunit